MLHIQECTSFLAQENEPFDLKFAHGRRHIAASERRRLPLLSVQPAGWPWRARQTRRNVLPADVTAAKVCAECPMNGDRGAADAAGRKATLQRGSRPARGYREGH